MLSASTMEQMKTHGVNGKKIRLDSKLLNSNIATSSRIELILEAIRVFIQEIDPSNPDLKIKEGQRDFLQELKTKTTSNVLFGKTNKQKEQLLEQSGYIIRKLSRMTRITSIMIYYSGFIKSNMRRTTTRGPIKREVIRIILHH